MKKLLVILAFAAVFVVKLDPVSAKSFDSPTEFVAVEIAEMPEILSEPVLEIKVNHFYVNPEPVDEITDVGKLSYPVMELPYLLILSKPIQNTSKQYLLTRARHKNRGHLRRHCDPDVPYNYLS